MAPGAPAVVLTPRCFFCRRQVDAVEDHCAGCGFHVCAECNHRPTFRDVFGDHQVAMHRAAAPVMYLALTRGVTGPRAAVGLFSTPERAHEIAGPNVHVVPLHVDPPGPRAA